MAEITQQQDTRREFIDALVKLAEQDDKIVLIVPDVGFNYIDEFQKRFPDRYFNLGVTEQSTMIIAAGLALAGLKPYVYSMINFVTFRPYEMVRNAVCLHNANVKIIGVKGSEKYKFLGFSHNLITDDEDIKVLKHLPNIKTYTPKVQEVKQVISDTYKLPNPCYIRL
jgi:transketolase